MNWMDDLRGFLRNAVGRPATGPARDEVSCHEATGALFDWLDGELPADEMSRIGAHLETCAICYPRLVFEKAFLEAVSRASQASEIPAGLRSQVLSALEEEGLSTS
jgi:anti-sigma factor (TIGR02949 family)